MDFLPWARLSPSGLFFAPLAKAGFDTVSGASTVTNVILPSGNPGSLTFQTAYKFYSYGFRVGELGLSGVSSAAPDIHSYFDMTVGRFSNLQSFICHTADQRGSNDAALTAASSCAGDYPKFFQAAAGSTPSNIYLSRKQLYRLSMEGLIKVPLRVRRFHCMSGSTPTLGSTAHSQNRWIMDTGHRMTFVFSSARGWT